MGETFMTLHVERTIGLDFRLSERMAVYSDPEMVTTRCIFMLGESFMLYELTAAITPPMSGATN